MPETFPPCQKAPSVRGLSPLGDWGSPACCSLLPSRLSPYHLPQRGRLFFGPETFPLCQKAPSVRGLSPLGDWGSAPPTAHSFRHGCAVPPPSRREALVRAGNFPSLLKGSLREGAVAARRLGECYPKYSCISAFFINSSLSRLCCTTRFSSSNRSTKYINMSCSFSGGQRISNSLI